MFNPEYIFFRFSFVNRSGQVTEIFPFSGIQLFHLIKP